MKITILTDNPESWFMPYGTKLEQALRAAGHEARYVFQKQEIVEGDICFLLSCVSMVEKSYLDRNKHNVVVHASDLPKGKGFSPLQWQILAGSNRIVLTAFEAVKSPDAGPYYFKSIVNFTGTELLGELREKIGPKIVEMCLQFVTQKDSLKPVPQAGAESSYPRRIEADDELDAHKTIAEQFNHFRIADNERSPVFFRHLGSKYILKIYKAKQ